MANLPSSTAIARTPAQIGAAIRRARKQRNLTQVQLGQLVALRQAKISEIENGTPGTALTTLCDVLAALDMDLLLQPRDSRVGANIEDVF